MTLKSLVAKGLRNPEKIQSFITSKSARHHIGRAFNQSFHSQFGRKPFNTSGVDIFSEDWDNLIILDAMRYDSMSAAINRHQYSWELESRISRGSQTPEWLYANFAGRQLHDVVYVTASAMPHYLGVANPKTPRQEQYGFNLDIFKLVDVWADPPETAIETYADRNETDVVIPAKSMIKPAKEAIEAFPNKRIIIHLVQPHDPYWGEVGASLYETSAQPWQDKLNGNIDMPLATLREAYKENVDIAIQTANEIVKRLEGKTVITSDHGEYLLERSSPIPTREILHPKKIYTETLVKVPWVEIDGERREIKAGAPNSREQVSKEGIDEQLGALGYL